MDVVRKNRHAWDRLVERGNRWTIPTSSAEIAAARIGQWEIYLTETKPVPRDWFPDLSGADVLCLASGGGQQGPVLAAAGATVTVFDNSPKQLAKDQQVGERENLTLQTVLGDMRDLSIFPNESFDLIVHPVSNIFVPSLHSVWSECYRVLRNGRDLLAGIVNPMDYTFDPHWIERGELRIKYSLPYSDLDSISEEERIALYGEDAPIEFSHTMEEQIGGQIWAGFLIAGFYEDHRSNSRIKNFLPSYFATRARKLD